MKLLALDTSSMACAVGVIVDEQVFTRDEQQPREHTRILMPMIRATLAEAGIKLAELDAIVLGNGPGSFIGMRIAASVAQGLAYGADLKVVPVSSMAAVAAAVGTGTVVVTQDAHMHQVYLGIYEDGPDGVVIPAIAERLHGLDEIAELARQDSAVAAGFGWQRYPDLLAANRRHLSGVSDLYYPSARELLRLGQHGLIAGATVAPEDINPAYLRQKVAEKPSFPTS